ncbi:hypothetical protein ACFW16_35530 [Inquilinus sp. NPDC058860]|uniref:hypothetical protein n=1 Tax=Inquilinus sp. NPDC058860 TaxID=3346652 RepID=UPI0036CF8385
MIDGLDLEDLPDRSVTLLQSGKASVKPLSQSRVLELHRDTICSAAVRAAAECLAALPIDTVEVVMPADLLDRGSGHIGVTPVLYLRATAQALGMVNLPLTDPPPWSSAWAAISTGAGGKGSGRSALRTSMCRRMNLRKSDR